jgi:hypothetical protein
MTYPTPGTVGFAHTTGVMGKLSVFGFVAAPCCATAFAALALAPSGAVGVLVGVFVTRWAVSFSALKMGSPRSHRRASHILGVRDRFKVVRPHALMHTAQMVKFKPFWYAAHGEFVGNTVREHVPAPARRNAVTISVTVSLPNPTPLRLSDLQPKPIFPVALRSICEGQQRIAAPPPVHVVPIAPSASGMLAIATINGTPALCHVSHSSIRRRTP